ncbi:hypothetical protein K450DRAFT_236382 [Umbelopsis ramanniana AG]|uniref:SH3 domain-containing protein n=1 Tax=Umbelopsis ramanniana AG TaxID=1314678 RepID=A0AAD5EBZ8_UMBRA|nr:uncharacterized protein K450DRAFT_236382 [Umbelopsis ramanniana AG]KAI8580597.1 hypothetical protein K450DRAFT_236382 [Umbelopsis ramanniana AG]
MSRRAGIDSQTDRVQQWRLQSSDDIIEEDEFDFEDDDDDDDEDDRIVELDDDLRSSMTSSPSIPDSDIDFDLVYALHTFVATVDGQASVVKGDALTLLDDSNSYWWLVKVLKTGEIGYIPAENIETPFERLARLNKHRNVELTSLQANMHIINDIPPRNTRGKSVTMSKGIAYQSHIIIVGKDADDIDEEEFQVWVEEMENDADSDTDERRSVLAEPTRGDSTPVFEKRTELRRHLLDSSHGILDKSVDDAASLRNQEHKSSDLVLNDQQRSTGGYVNTKITPIKLAQLPSNVDIPSTILQTAEKKNGLKRLFSLGKKPKAELPLRRSATISIRDDDLETNWSTSVSSSIDELQQDDTSISSSRQTSLVSENSTQVTVLRVFAGNVNLGTNYKTVVVDSNTNAEDLIKRAVSRFHIQQIEGNSVDSPNSRVEYYLSVKTMDGDELTLTSQDKPLSIFQSLTAHLTTPLPSLTHVKQLREKASTVEVTRLGVSRAQNKVKGNFGEDSVIRFYLHKRIKRVHEREGQVYIKISVYADDENNSTPQNKKSSNRSSIMKSKKKTSDHSSGKYRERIDKLIAIGSNATVAEVTLIALEKFHILNGVVDGVEDDEDDRALITSFSKDLDHYRLMVVRRSHETLLNPTDLVVDVLEIQSVTNQVKGSSDTSDLRFVLKKTGKVGSRHSKPSHRPSGRIAPAPISPQSPVKDMHSPINLSNRRLSINNDGTTAILHNQPEIGETDFNDHTKHVMSKLDVALTNLERDRLETASGRLKNSQLLRNPTFPIYQKQQRRPLSSTGSDPKMLSDSPPGLYNDGSVEELLKKPQPIAKLTKISDSTPSLSFSPSPLSLSSSPISESSLSDIFDLQEMMFLVNNGISYLESKEQTQWDETPSNMQRETGSNNKHISHPITELSQTNQSKESLTGPQYSKLDELEKVRKIATLSDDSMALVNHAFLFKQKELKKMSAARVF